MRRGSMCFAALADWLKEAVFLVENRDERTRKDRLSSNSAFTCSATMSSSSLTAVVLNATIAASLALSCVAT